MDYYNFWFEDSDLYRALPPEWPRLVDNDLSSSQPQQDYLPSAPEYPPPVVTQHHQYHINDGDSTSNDQHPHIATQQPSHNASFNHLHSPSSNDPLVNNPESSGNICESSPSGGQPDPVHDNPPTSLTSSSLYVCKWNDGRGPCNKALNKQEMKKHIPSHLPRGNSHVICRWEGCTYQQPMRRDTIIRHIRQIDLKIDPRRNPQHQ
ncbi:hypothetical protein BDR06DRAFT_719693 [Suillus hirtellus]|nr:hypothetical protein BDR06DRAFT_719693 [Suillus hirtellus]